MHECRPEPLASCTDGRVISGAKWPVPEFNEVGMGMRSRTRVRAFSAPRSAPGRIPRGAPGEAARRSSDDERGAAAVEFALVSLLLIGLLLGIVQVSILMWAFQAGAHGAREGAREWAVDPCNAKGMDNAALTRNRIGGAAVGGVSITPSFSAGSPPEAGDTVTVVVEFDTHDATGGFLPSLTHVARGASARVEDVEECG